MFTLFCFITPSFIVLKIIEIIVKDKKNSELIIDYFVINFIVNFFTILLFSFALKNNEVNLVSLMSLYSAYTIKYCFVAVIISILFSFFYATVQRNVQINIDISKGKKNERKK